MVNEKEQKINSIMSEIKQKKEKVRNFLKNSRVYSKNNQLLDEVIRI